MLIYVDTNIWIYAYENDPVFGASARRMLARAKMQEHQLAGSLLVLGELMVLPRHQNNQFALAMYRRLFDSKLVTLLPYSARVMDLYSELRAKRKLKPVDALHVATAAYAEVDIFVTEDRGLLTVGTLGKTRMANLETAEALM